MISVFAGAAIHTKYAEGDLKIEYEKTGNLEPPLNRGEGHVASATWEGQKDDDYTSVFLSACLILDGARLFSNPP